MRKCSYRFLDVVDKSISALLMCISGISALAEKFSTIPILREAWSFPWDFPAVWLFSGKRWLDPTLGGNISVFTIGKRKTQHNFRIISIDACRWKKSLPSSYQRFLWLRRNRQLVNCDACKIEKLFSRLSFEMNIARESSF